MLIVIQISDAGTVPERYKFPKARVLNFHLRHKAVAHNSGRKFEQGVVYRPPWVDVRMACVLIPAEARHTERDAANPDSGNQYWPSRSGNTVATPIPIPMIESMLPILAIHLRVDSC